MAPLLKLLHIHMSRKQCTNLTTKFGALVRSVTIKTITDWMGEMVKCFVQNRDPPGKIHYIM